MERLKGVPPRQSVQLNTLQPSKLKRFCIREARRRNLSLSQFVRGCIQAMKDHPDHFPVTEGK